MVTAQFNRTFGFLKTTAIGGVFFLLPFAVLIFLLGQVTQVVLAVARNADEIVHFETPLGYAILVIGSLATIVLACFLAGILARRSLAKKFTRFVEKYLVMLFPRYAIFKEQLSGNIGGQIYRNRLKPILIRLEDYHRIAFEVDSCDRAEPDASNPPGHNTLSFPNQAVVYLPGSPDPWNGMIALVDRSRISPAPLDFNSAVGVMETLGHDLEKILQNQTPQSTATPEKLLAGTSLDHRKST